MKIQTFSVVVGGSACNGKCPYCVSKLTGCNNGIIAGQEPMEINKRNFDIGCNFAKQSGVSTVLLTSKGEPLIYHRHITRYLELLEKWNFPFIELQTNGILLKSMSDTLLKEWYQAGLTTVSLSCVHWRPKKNKVIFGDDINLTYNIEKLHGLGFAVRISCVMIDNYVDSVEDIMVFAEWCKKRGVEQLTVRPVGNISDDEVGEDSSKRTIQTWIGKHSHTVWQNIIGIGRYFDNPTNATTLLTLAHGAKVYDYRDQNISINSCLTRNDNPDDIRQLIFSPDGHLRYDWVKQGAILI